MQKLDDLNYIEVRTITQNIFGKTMHAKRVESISNAALGVIAGASLIINVIGKGLAAAKDLLSKHAIKQVDRLLSNPKFIPWDLFQDWVLFVISARKEIVVAMDWTDFDADKQATIAINMVTSHGRATPLLWKTVSKTRLKNKRNDYEDELLCKLEEILPKDIKVTVLADRGFGDIKLYEFLGKELNFNFVIRFRSNIKVTANGITRFASEWIGKGGRTKTLRNALLTNDNYEVPTVVCVKDKNMKDAWCIAASDPKIAGSIVVKWYAKRWSIEPQFRDIKDIRFGMGLSETKISKTERRDRLLMISALAVVILTFLGAAGEKTGMDKHLKPNTVKRRTLSLFNQGKYYYQALRNMAIEKRRLLLRAFVELIKEQQTLANILGLI